jgi:hypothetical protein
MRRLNDSSIRQTASRWSRKTLAVVLAVVATTVAGCGRRAGDRGKLYPVEGQVLLGAKPLAGALLVLYPQGVANDALPSQAKAGPDGRFHLRTYVADDGAPAGDYAVTVVSYPVKPGEGGASANVLPKKYASPKTTDLRVKIERDPTAPLLIALQDEQKRPADGRRANIRQAYE